jgi:ABC-type multidrug transport system fused ATPase/permease subunit
MAKEKKCSTSPSETQCSLMMVKIPFRNGGNEEVKLLDFVEFGKNKMDTLALNNVHLKKRDSEVLIIGTTGVGKSVLINYLNGTPLVNTSDSFMEKLLRSC